MVGTADQLITTRPSIALIRAAHLPNPDFHSGLGTTAHQMARTEVAGDGACSRRTPLTLNPSLGRDGLEPKWRGKGVGPSGFYGRGEVGGRPTIPREVRYAIRAGC